MKWVRSIKITTKSKVETLECAGEYGGRVVVRSESKSKKKHAKECGVNEG